MARRRMVPLSPLPLQSYIHHALLRGLGLGLKVLGKGTGHNEREDHRGLSVHLAP